MKGFLFCGIGCGEEKMGWCGSQSICLMPVEMEKEVEWEPERLSETRGDGKRGRAGTRAAV
jgi:hypothetical protein